MRAFIAIELPQNLKEKIAQAQITFKKCGLTASWVKPDNCHITMRFLGETPEDRLPAIKTILEKTAGDFPLFEITAGGFGFFPDQRRPRVFFLKTDQEENLKNLYKNLEDGLVKLGFARETRFTSHITLCRIKAPENISSLSAEKDKINLAESFTAQGLTLFKSTLNQTGAIYEALSRAKFASNK